MKLLLIYSFPGTAVGGRNVFQQDSQSCSIWGKKRLLAGKRMIFGAAGHQVFGVCIAAGLLSYNGYTTQPRMRQSTMPQQSGHLPGEVHTAQMLLLSPAAPAAQAATPSHGEHQAGLAVCYGWCYAAKGVLLHFVCWYRLRSAFWR